MEVIGQGQRLELWFIGVTSYRALHGARAPTLDFQQFILFCFNLEL